MRLILMRHAKAAWANAQQGDHERPLDAVGQAILSEVDGKRSFGEITAALAAKFAAPRDQIAADSAAFLGALRDRLFLEVRP